MSEQPKIVQQTINKMLGKLIPILCFTSLIAGFICEDIRHRKNNYVKMDFRVAEENVYVLFKAKDEDCIERLTIKIGNETYLSGSLADLASNGGICVENEEDIKNADGLKGYFALSKQKIYYLPTGKHDVRIIIEDKKGNLESAVGSINVTEPYRKQQKQTLLL